MYRPTAALRDQSSRGRLKYLSILFCCQSGADLSRRRVGKLIVRKPSQYGPTLYLFVVSFARCVERVSSTVSSVALADVSISILSAISIQSDVTHDRLQYT